MFETQSMQITGPEGWTNVQVRADCLRSEIQKYVEKYDDKTQMQTIVSFVRPALSKKIPRNKMVNLFRYCFINAQISFLENYATMISLVKEYDDNKLVCIRYSNVNRGILFYRFQGKMRDAIDNCSRYEFRMDDCCWRICNKKKIEEYLYKKHSSEF